MSPESPSVLPAGGKPVELAVGGGTAVSPGTEGIWHMGKNKDIREAVEAELDFDPLVDAADITVRNINGDVALNGTVPSYPQCVAASAAAQRVAGVKNV